MPLASDATAIAGAGSRDDSINHSQDDIANANAIDDGGMEVQVEESATLSDGSANQVVAGEECQEVYSSSLNGVEMELETIETSEQSMREEQHVNIDLLANGLEREKEIEKEIERERENSPQIDGTGMAMVAVENEEDRMVQCNECFRWVHALCEGIDQVRKKYLHFKYILARVLILILLSFCIYYARLSMKR